MILLAKWWLHSKVMGLLEAGETWFGGWYTLASLPPRNTIMWPRHPRRCHRQHIQTAAGFVWVFCLPSSPPPTHITTSQWCRTTLLLCDLLNLISFPPPSRPQQCHRAGKLRQALAYIGRWAWAELIIPVAINRIYFKREILLILHREVIYV